MGKNDITGDNLTSKAPNKAYDDGWDRIFGKKKSKDAHAEEFNGEILERANWYGYAETDEDTGLSSEFAHPAYTRYPHLKEKNYKDKQQDLTELNGDGNRDRGRYGEDLTEE